MSADPPGVHLPDAEAALETLAAGMRTGVAHDAAFVGIYSGGAWLAERLAKLVPGTHPVGFIDVSYYRDDFASKGLKGGARRSELPFDVTGATIVLIDDVLYTGRSTRAAINELFDFGRPASIELAVLVDRKPGAAGELPAEAARALGQLVRRAVGVHGETHEQARRTPLGDERGDRLETVGVALALDRRERMREARREVAHRHADAAGAEIECEHGAVDERGGARGGPTHARRRPRGARSRCRASTLRQAAGDRPARRTGRPRRRRP